MKKASPKKSTSKKPFDDFYTNDDMKRHMSALAENFGDGISAVTEQFLGLNTKVDSLGQKLENVGTQLSEKLDSHTIILGQLMVDVEEIKSGMREKIDRKEFTALEKRMVALESYVFTGKSKVKK